MSEYFVSFFLFFGGGGEWFFWISWGQQGMARAAKMADWDVSDYDVFLSPLEDFKKAMEEAGLGEKVVYLDRGDEYRFKVKS